MELAQEMDIKVIMSKNFLWSQIAESGASKLVRAVFQIWRRVSNYESRYMNLKAYCQERLCHVDAESKSQKRVDNNQWYSQRPPEVGFSTDFYRLPTASDQAAEFAALPVPRSLFSLHKVVTNTTFTSKPWTKKS